MEKRHKCVICVYEIDIETILITCPLLKLPLRVLYMYTYYINTSHLYGKITFL